MERNQEKDKETCKGTYKEIYQNRRNPILPPRYHIPDVEAHVMPDGMLYLYGSYDNQEDAYCSEEYHVVSTPDMEHWTVHGTALEGRRIPWFGDPDAPKYPGVDWSHPTPFIRKLFAGMEGRVAEEKCAAEEKSAAEDKRPLPLLYAPDAVYRDGKYYLYFCMPDDSEGVAVSLRPQGPFEHPVQLPCGGIDPAVFLDEDGQAYLYWGQFASHGVRLNPDMVSFDRGEIVDRLVTEEEHFFHEGSSVRKIGKTYYYVYTDMERGKPTALGYAMGQSPLGPFRYQGIIIDNEGCDPDSWNNHGSIQCFHGQWYVFYHRSSRGGKLHRRLCIEPIQIMEDGRIPEVKMTSQGAGEPFAPGERILGYQTCGLKGSCYIDVDADYGEKLTHISQGDEAVFRYVRSGDGWKEIGMRCNGSGEIEVYFGHRLAGTVIVEQGACRCSAFAMEAGEYELTLRFRKAQGLEVLEFTLY